MSLIFSKVDSVWILGENRSRVLKKMLKQVRNRLAREDVRTP